MIRAHAASSLSAGRSQHAHLPASGPAKVRALSHSPTRRSQPHGNEHMFAST